MFNKFRFTVIISCCSDVEYLEKSISSILNQTINFKYNVELIILNNINNQEINELILYYKEKYPNNISIIVNYEKTYIQLYNDSLHILKGKYVTFLDSNDCISYNTLSSVYKLFEIKDVDIIKVAKKYLNPILKEYDEVFAKTEMVNLLAEPKKIITSFDSLFIRCDAINCNFNTELSAYSKLNFIYKILADKNNYVIDKVPKYYVRQRYLKAPQEIDDVDYYLSKLINLYKNIIDSTRKAYRYTPAYIQYMLVDDLSKLIKNNNLIRCDKSSLNEFCNLLLELLQSLSTNVIKSSNIADSEKSFLIYLKNNKEKIINKMNEDVILQSRDFIIDSLKNINLLIDSTYIEENQLHIEGSFKTYFDKKDIVLTIISKQNDKEILLNSDNNFMLETQETIYLDIPWYFTYKFEVKIPINDENISENQFELSFKDSNDIICHPKIKYELTSNMYNTYSYKSKESNYLIYEEDSKLITHFYKKISKRSPIFSIIMAVYNSEKYLTEAIDSIINQTLNFERYVQLILVDDGSCDNSMEIMREYQRKYPYNILLLSKEHGGVASARNLGLAHAIGKYVNFLDSDDYLSKNALKVVNKLFKKNHKKVDVVSLLIEYFEMDDSTHELCYKFKKSRLLDIDKHPNYPQISVSSTFIKRNAINDLSFEKNLICGEDSLFINRLLLKRRKMVTTDIAKYYCRKRSSEDSIRDLAIGCKEYYTDRLNNFHMNLINDCIERYGQIPDFIQYTLAYDLSKYLKIYELDVFDDDNEIEEFYTTFKDVLSYIQLDSIRRNRNIRGNIRNFMLYMKNQEDYHIEFDNGEIALKQGDIRLELFNSKRVGIDFIEIKDGFLNIGGYFNTFFDKDIISVNLVQESLNDNTSIIHLSNLFEYPQEDRRTIKYLSIPWKYFHHFEFKLPLNELINTKLTFLVRYDDGRYVTKYNPELGLRLPSGLSTTGIYMAKQSVIVFFQGKSLKVIPESYLSMLRLEFSVARKLFKDKRDGYISVFAMRILYLLLYPFMKNKKIWLFNDRPLIADDNAKHLFKYSVAQNDGINKYYVLRRESEDFDKMKKINKNIVEFASLKHKILFFFAQKHISAFVNEDYRNPFYEPGGFDHRRLLAGLSTTQRYFLQHGVIFANVTRSLKKYNNNISLLLCSAEKERNSFFNWHYNFSEDVVTVLGLPRHDNLTSDDTKRQIVFMPTWRGNLKTENALFNSEFFKSLNSFINNERLHKFLKENDYEFVFKPHPELLKHLDNMKLNENLKLALDESYQDIFRDSSILITDYSSVAFDFAYLKKPLIYYQPNDDYPYEEGYMDFETMAFGDVIYTEEGMIEKIKEYINNGCIMEDKYKERVNNFFKYTDNKNCKRTYEWILNH